MSHVAAGAAQLLGAGARLSGLTPQIRLAGPIRFLGRDGADRRGFDIDGVLLRFSGMGYSAELR